MQWNKPEYQERALHLAMRKRRFALWMEMGLGKSVVAATAIAERIDQGFIGRALIVAPLRVITQTWPTELSKWDHLRWLTHRTLRGTTDQRELALEHRSDTDIDLVNYEMLPWIVEYLRRKRWRYLPWQMIVFDEASKLKGDTRRFRAARALSKRVDYVLELTGMPSPNGLLDLYRPIYCLDQGQRLGQTVTAYRDRWFQPAYDGWGYSPRGDADRQVRAQVDDLVCAMRNEDYLTLPERIDTTVEIVLPQKLRARYDQLREEMYIQLEQNEVVAANAGVLLGKCLQFSNGAMYTGGPGQGNVREYEELHSAKLDALEDVVEEMEGEPILVPYLFRFDIERIKRRFPFAEVMDSKGDIVQQWNQGRVRMLLCPPDSPGLNLQSAGRVIAWFGVPWSHWMYGQTNARLHRQGQTRPVHVYHLLCQDTVDAKVLGALHAKRRVQDVLLEELRAAKPGSAAVCAA